MTFVVIPYSYGQTVRRTFEGIDFGQTYYDSLLKEYGSGKKLPDGYTNQTLQALAYFPELKNVRIVFRIRRISSPLMVRPSIASSVFRSPARRTYIIFISSHSPAVDSILMKNLPLDAQIGVIGHELSHVSYFIHVGRVQMIKVGLGNFSAKFLNRIEFETDRATIEHGLGWQLLKWSELVRVKLKLERWRGADEYLEGKTSQPRQRYMNPESIRAVMQQCPIYQP